MKAISLVQTNDKQLNQIQQNFKQSIDPLIKNPITSGNLVKSQKIVVGANTINHGLAYAITGYIIVGNSAVINTSDNMANNPAPTQSFVLTSDAPATINVYCF